MKFRRLVSVLFLGVLCAASYAQGMSDEELAAAIEANPWRAACGHLPYYAPEFVDTPAPAGYKPFYVSHYGRHGSRYQGSMDQFESVIEAMGRLEDAGLLTAVGDSVFYDLQYIADMNRHNLGMLTQKGLNEHKGISERLYRRVPSVFGQKNRTVVNCTSTSAQRAIMSMAGFATELQSNSRGLDIRMNVGFPEIPYKTPGGNAIGKDEIGRILAPYEGAISAFPLKGQVFDILFKDGAKADEIIGEYGRFTFDLITDLAGSGCLDIDVNPLRFFPTEVLLEYYKVHNLYFCGRYGYLNGEVSLSRMHAADQMVRLMIKEADDAVEGNSRCADLRFGHDTPAGPMQVLFDLEGMAYEADIAESYRYYPIWKHCFMGSNIQLIFYRGRGGDVLVKILKNEVEQRVNGLEAINDVFYKWGDLREHLLRRMGDYKDVPQFSIGHLEQKAARIRELQKDEAVGFYFFTDTHFPVNPGNAAPMMCYLENAAGARKVFFGGDMKGNSNEYWDGMFPQSCTMEQLRGETEVYMLRGNHDCMTHTKPVDSLRRALPQWKTSEFLRAYTSVSAVYNPEDPNSTYFYVDDKASKVRFLCYDTTDSVKGNLVVYDVHDSQLKWMAEEGILGAPKGWRLVFVSHVPLAEDIASKNSVKIGRCISALVAHGTYSVGDRTYDFSSRKDLKPLFAISGHKHSDRMSGAMGIPNIVCMSDGRNPSKADGRKSGDITEQAFDYVSVSKDCKTVRLVMIGFGEDREYSCISEQ